MKRIWQVESNFIYSKYTEILAESRICSMYKAQTTNKKWVEQFVKIHFQQQKNPNFFV